MGHEFGPHVFCRDDGLRPSHRRETHQQCCETLRPRHGFGPNTVIAVRGASDGGAAATTGRWSFIDFARLPGGESPDAD